MGQPPPSTATTQDRQETMENFARGVCGPAASRLGLGDRGFEHRPFLIREIGRVRLSRFHAPNDHPSRLPEENF
jgi:hypothetical protein